MGYLIGYNIQDCKNIIVKEVDLDDEIPDDDLDNYNLYIDKMLDYKIKPKERPHYQAAKEANMTHWNYIEQEIDPYFVSICFNKHEHPHIDITCDDEEERCIEYAEKRKYDYAFVYNIIKFDEWEIKNIKLPSWDNRSTASSQEEAIKYLASLMSDNFPDMDEKIRKEAKEFAEEWNIPFSYDLHNAYAKAFQIDYPAWNSSSKYC